MSKFLCIDPGSKLGFAVGSAGHVVSGSLEFKNDRFSGGGMRFVKFRKWLNEVHAAYEFTHVFFEEVRRHQGVTAAHIYGGFLAHLTEWCEEKGIPYQGYPVGTIKKSWCGSGNANKQLMIDEARRRGFRPADDNEADALAIFHLAISEYAETAKQQEAAQ